MELLSDKRLDEHLESDPFVVGSQEHNNEIGQRCSSHHGPPATSCIYGASASITLFGEEPYFDRIARSFPILDIALLSIILRHIGVSLEALQRPAEIEA